MVPFSLSSVLVPAQRGVPWNPKQDKSQTIKPNTQWLIFKKSSNFDILTQIDMYGWVANCCHSPYKFMGNDSSLRSYIRPYKVNSWFLNPARIILIFSFFETLLLFRQRLSYKFMGNDSTLRNYIRPYKVNSWFLNPARIIFFNF